MNDVMKRALRTDFRTFFKKAFAELHGGDMPEEARYIDVICDFLQNFDKHEFRRGIINLPPRHLKTILCTICLAAWRLGHNPATHIMIACYGEDLSRDIADKIRRILRSKWYQQVFPTRLSSDRYQVTDFTTQQGGSLFATSLGGAITGRGADMIIIDDPVKIADAANPAVHQRVADIFESEILNRLNKAKTGRVLLVGHRLHPDDLFGRFAERPGWRQLVLTFIADEAVRIKHGDKTWKRTAGELLRPDAYTEEQVEEYRAMAGPPDFEALFQQNPSGVPWAALSGDNFPAYVGHIPRDCPLIISIDPAQTPRRTASYSVIQAWAAVGEDLVLMDQWREQVRYEKLKEAGMSFVNRHPSVVLIEATSVGKALAEFLRARTDSPVLEIDPGNHSKLDRLKACIGMILAGRVKLTRNALFRDEFVDEFASFPYGDFDDQVDATTQVLKFLATEPSLSPRKPPALSAVGYSDGTTSIRHRTEDDEAGGRGVVSVGKAWRRYR